MFRNDPWADIRTWFRCLLVGIALVMLWIIKGLFSLSKTRRGRKVLLVAGKGVVVLARSDEARKLYARARTAIREPAFRRA